MNLESIVTSLEKKIGALRTRSIEPKIIVVGKSIFYTIVQGVQSNQAPNFSVEMFPEGSTSVSAMFSYSRIPIYFNNSLTLPGTSDLVEVFGD